jgi:hypothetical protein
MKKSLLAAVLLPLCLLGKPAIAEEMQKPTQKPLVDLVIDCKTGKIPTENEYENSYVYFSYYSNHFSAGSALNLTIPEKKQVEDLLINVKSGAIDSYDALVSSSTGFSQDQRLALLAAIANSSYDGYDYGLLSKGVLSQEDFFEKLQSIFNGHDETIGVCRHIGSNVEQLANDIGLRAAAVTGTSGGIGHVYDIVKLDNGTAIVNGGNILITDTKNIERMLEMYQKDDGSPVFHHLFFEDSRLKYELITKDGRNFLDFIGYDESTDKLEESLIEKQKPRMPVTMSFKTNDQMLSTGVNFLGFFGKLGELHGDVNSPIEKMKLVQVGYDYGFSFPDILDINCTLSGIVGDSIQKDGLEISPIGADLDLMINTNKETGLNLSSRLKGNIFTTTDSTYFYDLALQAGVSYKFQIKNAKITPYALGEFSLLPSDLGTYIYLPAFTEAKSGVVFQIPISKSGEQSLLIQPSYSYKPSEHEIDLSLKLKGKDVELYANGSLIKSLYDFNPDRLGIDAGVSASFGPFALKAGYKDEWQNYDGEIDDNYSLYVQGKIKFFFNK